MTQSPTDTEPFWRRPVVRVDAPHADPAVDTTDPLADDARPTADQVEAPAPESLQNFGALHANGNAPAKATPRSVLSVNEAQRALTESHVRMARATDAQRTARGNVALALEKFQRATMQTCTPDQLIKRHLASEAQLRVDRAAGKVAPRGGQRRLGSAIDAYAFYTKASGRGAGGGRAFGRKAFPASMRGRVIPKSE
jgi:hypothetical protein